MEGGLTLSNKTITWGLAVIVFSLLATFFISQNFVFDRENRLENTLNDIAQAVKQNDWAKAEKSISEFDSIWEKGKYLTALNNAEQDFSDMDDAVENLKGAIEVENQFEAVQRVRQIQAHWKNFKKLVPQP